MSPRKIEWELRKIEMDIFDALPADMRAALNELDFAWSISEVATAYSMGWSTQRIIETLKARGIEKHRIDAATGHICGGQR